MKDSTNERYGMLECIPHIILDRKQEEMDKIPSEKKVRKIVFSLYSESSCIPDGFLGNFF